MSLPFTRPCLISSCNAGFIRLGRIRSSRYWIRFSNVANLRSYDSINPIIVYENTVHILPRRRYSDTVETFEQVFHTAAAHGVQLLSHRPQPCTHQNFTHLFFIHTLMASGAAARAETVEYVDQRACEDIQTVKGRPPFEKQFDDGGVSQSTSSHQRCFSVSVLCI